MTYNGKGSDSLNHTGIEETHRPGWLITFADSMSLLLTFFVLLIAFSSFDPVRMTSTMKSMNNFLGGGAKLGKDVTKASYYLSKKETDVPDSLINVRLSEQPISGEFGSTYKVDLGINSFQKVNALTKLLKNNPALLRILVHKKSAPPIKKVDLEEVEDAEEPGPPELPVTEAELSLQNLEHYMVGEQLQDAVKMNREPTGEVSFEIDCLALFEENTAMLKGESRELLLRIAHILRYLPNKIAVQNFTSKAFDKGEKIEDTWSLSLNRSTEIVQYFVTCEDQISEERFSILARGLKDDEWEKIQAVNMAGEGVIGITILAYSE